MYNKSLLQGSKIAPSQLRLDKAISIYEVVQKTANIQFEECRRNGQESEILFLTFFHLGTPEFPVNDIQETEEVAILCRKEDISFPDVYALRNDFPIGIAHSNALDFEHPVSLCMSDVPYADCKLQFSSYDFLQSIRKWMRENSLGVLHSDDRPIEPFFIPQKYCSTEYNIDREHVYGLLSNVTHNSCTFRFAKKQDATHFVVVVQMYPEVTRNFASCPKNVGDFLKYNDIHGLNVPEAILRNVSLRASNQQSFPVMVIVQVTQKRHSTSDIKEDMLFLLRLSSQSNDIIVRMKTLKSENFYKWFYSLNVEVIFPIQCANLLTNMKANGVKTSLDKVTIIGVGTLGSNILDLMIREGLTKHTTIIDDDFMFPHNFSRHILNTDYQMEYKVNSLQRFYHGISGQEVVPICANYLNDSELTPRYNMEIQNSDIIIDASTSVAVEHKLAFDSVCKGVRKCTVFLNPKGTDLVIFIEDKQRMNRIDFLEMAYLRILITEEKLQSHLDTSDVNVTNQFSCRAESTVMKYENVKILSSVAVQQIRKFFNNENPLIGIWNVNPEDSLVSRILIEPLKWHTREQDEITIYLADKVVDQIKEEREKAGAFETGGCLLGSYDKIRKIIYIFYIITAPVDSVSSETSFQRGALGVVEMQKQIDKKTFHQVKYLGEWHTHPSSSSKPSKTDQIQFVKKAEDSKCLDIPFVQLIFGTDGFYVKVVL